VEVNGRPAFEKLIVPLDGPTRAVRSLSWEARRERGVHEAQGKVSILRGPGLAKAAFA
jgi:hypothetical protein